MTMACRAGWAVLAIGLVSIAITTHGKVRALQRAEIAADIAAARPLDPPAEAAGPARHAADDVAPHRLWLSISRR